MSFSLLRSTSSRAATATASSASASAARAFGTSAARPLARMTILGHLADSPELIPTSTGREVLRYAVASNSGPASNRTVSWFRVTSFENDAAKRDFVRALPKGTLVMVEGEASMRTFTDNEGRTKSSLSVVQRHIEVIRRPYQPREGQQQENGESGSAESSM